jgi:hypothetical protein
MADVKLWWESTENLGTASAGEPYQRGDCRDWYFTCLHLGLPPPIVLPLNDGFVHPQPCEASSTSALHTAFFKKEANSSVGT